MCALLARGDSCNLFSYHRPAAPATAAEAMAMVQAGLGAEEVRRHCARPDTDGEDNFAARFAGA